MYCKPFIFIFSIDALLLPLTERDRKWVKNLPTIVKDINNSKTSLTGIAPIKAIKMKKVIYAKL